jgi:hypothetical protein
MLTGVSACAPALADAMREVLACPACHGPLRAVGDAVACGECDVRYPIRDGIPILMRASPLLQERERGFRDRLAARQASATRGQLLDEVARHHCIPVMRRRVAAFAAGFLVTDWIVDIGVGWGWHWEGLAGGPRVLGIDMSLANLRLGRRLLDDRVALVCADAAALPLRSGALAGAWSVQAFQHFPAEVLRSAQRELDRVLRHDGVLELYNLNPAPLLRAAYRLAGRRLPLQGRVGEMEINRRSAPGWLSAWSGFRPDGRSVATGYSELFFHPELRLNPRPYPERLEAWLSRRAPWLAASVARQVHLRLASGRG